MFGLAGKNGQQIVSVSTTYIYSMLRESRYLEQGERDRFVEDLRKLKLYPSDFTAISIRDGKSLSIKLEDMDENQFAGFLEVLGRYCIERSTTALG